MKGGRSSAKQNGDEGAFGRPELSEGGEQK